MLSRTTLLYGDEKMNRIRQAHVLIVGTGGVGGWAAEMLCRAGVGRLTLLDADTVAPSNINRQLPALGSTVGRAKVEVLAERFADIHPQAEIRLRRRQRVVSSVGAGAKTDITAIRFADVWQTYHCGLSKSVRSGLTRAGLKGHRLPVVFCTQQADRAALLAVEGERNKKTTAGTVSYMPATFGCFLAQYVLERL